MDQERNRDRVKAGIGVAAFHALLGYALITGLGIDVTQEVTDSLKVFAVPPESPPPVEEPVPAPVRTEAPDGAASPPSLKAQPSPIVAPPPKVRLDVPPPVASVPEPTPVAPGTDRTAGVASIDGPGTGTGGQGSGTGSGGQGSGTGGGGPVSRAERVRGRLANSDYPRAAMRAGAEGVVYVRILVGADGSVTRCQVTRSSGSEDLDSTTCRLIERRFEYRPARDAQGRPVADVVTQTYEWMLPFRR